MHAPKNTLIHRAARAVAPRTHRGTVLLLVLGSLALVLILAVVYAAIGKGDRRTARQTVARQDAQANVDAIAAHIADVIRRDVLNLVPEVSDSDALALLGRTTPLMRREAVDLPVTDYFFTSVPSLLGGVNGNQNTIDRMRFHPDGGHHPDLFWNRPPIAGEPFSFFAQDPRSASDPFLAATRPVDLGASNFNINLPPYLRMRDWSQISNLAPDGRFVNLFHLRGNFRAPSLDLTRVPGGNAPRLSLFDEDGNPTDELPFADMTGGTGGNVADWNKPMHWTMFQRRLFRPVNDPAFTGTAMGDPGDEDYWAYQYADADGDGFLDSRWFELVDYSNHLKPVSLIPDSDMRFFVAARAIDLSSLVNVTTATDFLAPTNLEHRLGAGPQDVNLFKLLHFTEHVFAHASGAEASAGGITYGSAYATGTGQAGDYGQFDTPVAQALGRKAYLRLTDGARQGRIRPFRDVPAINPNTGRLGSEDPASADLSLSDDIHDYTLNRTAQDRADYSAAVGSVYPGVSAGGNSRTAPYSVDDLVELLTFHGINDDRNFSKLEQAMSAANAGVIPSATYSHLRSDLDTADDAWAPTTLAPQDALERKYMRSAVDIRRMLTTLSGSRPLRSGILDQAQSFVELAEATDRKLTLDTLVVDDGLYPNAFDGDDIDDVRAEQSNLISNAFGVYLSTLAPELRQQDWDATLGASGDLDRTELMTQYYGHMGPELAVRLAGHMALNFRDMADAPYIDLDRNGVPDSATVLGLNLSDTTQLGLYNQRVDEPSVAVLRLSQDWNPAFDTGIMRDLWDADLRLDPDEFFDDPAIAIGGSVVSHAAMILYGNEPQPFLSQVSSMTMYTDHDFTFADAEGGGSPDPEWTPSTINGGAGPDNIQPTIDDFDGLPNIRGEVDAANEDFVFQALFVQIFNPFDVPIVLDHYYIEFGDSFYSFTDGTPGAPPVVLEPRSTMVVWASNPGDGTIIDQHLVNEGVRLPPRAPGTTAFEQMINRQLGTGVSNVRLARRFAPPVSGSIAGSGSYQLVPEGDVRDIFHDDPAAQSDANRVVMLWRDNADVTNPTTGRIDWAVNNLVTSNRATDQLVDRLRDTSDIPVARRSIAGAPTRGSLDRRLDLPQILSPDREMQVDNAVRGNDSNRAGPSGGFFAPTNGNNFNEGAQITVALWGNISRKDDSSFVSGSSAVEYYPDNVQVTSGRYGARPVNGTPVGALPAKVFEPSALPLGTGAYNAFNPSTRLIHAALVAGLGAELFPEELSLITDFVHPLEAPPRPLPYPAEASADIDQFWGDLQTAAQRPAFFVALSTPVFGRTGAATLSLPINASPVTDFGNYEGSKYIRMTVNQAEFRDLVSGRRTLRVGDMLLPLAVGAYRTPLEPGAAAPATPDGAYSANVLQRLEQYEAQWTTLGEALAAAMGYSDSVGPGGGRATLGPRDPFRSLAYDHTAGFPQVKGRYAQTVGATNILPYVLDRGQLRLDSFVPFIDLDADGLFDEADDIRRGLGIPMALSIFELTQAGSDLGIETLGSLDRPVMGTINANTAEPEVLRLHPALAMDMYDVTEASPFERLWWPRTLEQATLNPQPYALNLFRDASNREIPFADVGSMVAGYRDPARSTRLQYQPPRSIPGGTGTTLIDTFQVELIDPANPDIGVLVDRNPDADFLTNPTAELRSGIQNLRRGQGLLSVGELFAARDLRDTAVQHQMGGFARDARTIGVGFVDATEPNATGVLYPDQPALRTQREPVTFGNHLTGDLIGYAMNYGTAATGTGLDAYPGSVGGAALPIMPDQIPDSYDEQLVQLNALLNSVGVRSDYYAVWFVVQGYSESDTQGLSAGDPLVPSFSARYLLILDRSNVVKKGDQPRVLAYVQLPMLPPPPATGTF